jgi:3-deoxy-7-phosphoheptulonate synthase
MPRTENIHIGGLEPLVAPAELKRECPLTDAAADVVTKGREAVKAVLAGRDRRLMVVVGPCSIHDERAALEYARRVRSLSAEVSDRLLVLMRAYFEKPRTVMGWKGLINDPRLDGSFDMPTGLSIARRLLLDIGEVGVPVATEMLDPITPQYIADLVSWASIGARTTESQTHRQMASGLSMPIGYKNGTDGELQSAIDAQRAAAHPHSFLGIDQEGRTCVVKTTGNPWGCLVMRGGRSGPNHGESHIAEASARMDEAGLVPSVVVDCSHANCGKDHRRQRAVFEDVVRQRTEGRHEIIGVMLESHLFPGRQPLDDDPSALRYGVSITDPCIGWDETEELIRDAARELAG